MSNYDKIKSRYRGQFIAICDGEIIGDTDHQILLEKIREKVEEKDIDSIFETYISKTDDILMM
jgi:RNA binding exosome subunit